MAKVIGIDIGGTSLKGVVTDSEGHILAEHKRATDAAKGRDVILQHLGELIQVLLDAEQQVEAIGIGTAGRVNLYTGEVVFATDNLPGWQGTNLVAWVTREHSLPVAVDNDGNTALIGETWLGAGRQMENVIMLTLGTGVGGANMWNGRLVRGTDWNGGEWGHVILYPEGLPCNCGKKGCIEQYLSGTALVRSARALTGKPYLDGAEWIQDVRGGNPDAVYAMEQYITHLLLVLENIHMGLNPEAVILGGGVLDSSDYWWPDLQREMEQRGLHITVKPAELGNRAGALGAAKLALDLVSYHG
ncbi:ROK family protein [Paenibacillus larvae]|uniref:Transcriptional regulator n=2 Tax=Paenibacillus larvae TaxID=1464 RepID=A0A6C0QWI3_9BACL|nr:ROK family protein [Paenibacillus larvae]AVF22857.1 transcriptional regulator [Paenibacillus larvae subsp. larvae]ETK26487.1 transcriptional regulator [Paenibacillus larvae subsp. larvae DSM 25719]MCY7476749.1 ROK family protein [Paenibacillus larvae]MCY7491743.1 ROK family protein [Paenibacillus larvae]MCY9565806.1 ROK family protein [Paenibacillus larvae]